MKTIVLIDPFWTGHHPTYLKLISQAVLSCGHSVVVFCPNPQEVQQWIAVNSGPDRERFHAFELHEPQPSQCPFNRLRDVLNGLAWWRAAARAVRKARRATGAAPDLVFFAWLDSYLNFFLDGRFIDLVFRYQWSGLFFHPRHLRDSAYSPQDLGYYEELQSRFCTGVALLDEGIAARMQARLPAKRVVVFPDVADNSPPDRSFPVAGDIAGKAAGRKIISLLGGLARRKGMLTLLDAARAMQPDDCFFVFCGALVDQAFDPGEAEALRKIAAAPPANCFFHFSYIPGEAQFNALVELSDILFAGYENFPHSSNIVTKAALFEKPVIVSQGGCMAERVAAFRLGESFEKGDVTGCIAAIRRVLGRNDGTPDFAGFRSLHSEARFSEAVRQVVTAGITS